jgi:NTP pyrophosphatase (non-canonical NTP hydrolase)
VALTFAEYQRRLADLERERGWDRILPSHTFLHMAEELGEIGRVIQCLEGYRESDASPEALQQELAGELADLAAFVFKLASQQGIDVGTAMQDQLRKFTSRYHDVELGRREMDRYVAYQEHNLDWIRGGRGEHT